MTFDENWQFHERKCGYSSVIVLKIMNIINYDLC